MAKEPKYEDIAPTLLEAGLTPKDLRRALRPRASAPTKSAQYPAEAKRAVFEFWIQGEKDAKTLAKLATVPEPLAATLVAEGQAVRDALKDWPPVPHDAVEPEDKPAEAAVEEGAVKAGDPIADGG